MSSRLYIDETGDHFSADPSDLGKRYLGLIGVSFDRDPYLKFQRDLEDFKRKHLPYDPDDPPILHRKDIVNHHGPFRVLMDDGKRAAFDTDLLELFKTADFRVVAVVIDKHSHWQKTYRSLTHPYHYCLEALLERYCGWLAFTTRRGDVLAEARGKLENQALQAAYDSVWKTGTRWMASNKVQATLTSKQAKIKLKRLNIAGLQIADLLAHPLTRDVLTAEGRLPDCGSSFANEIANIVTPKYNRQIFDRRIRGYGRILLD